MSRLSFTYPQLASPDGDPLATAFTKLDESSGTCSWRGDRPALVVSGCSWTPDDDFTLMVEALDIYNATVASSPNIRFHKLICIVTGELHCSLLTYAFLKSDIKLISSISL